jgi:hypothetical protein
MHAAMMAIQNFGFFIMYYDIWGDTPAGDATGGVCDETRLWVGVMALDCWGVAHLCVGMAYAGYTEGHFWFPFYCASHRASVAARARASCLHAAASPALLGQSLPLRRPRSPRLSTHYCCCCCCCCCCCFLSCLVCCAGFFHLFIALGYVLCTLTIPLARWSDDGKACAKLAPTNGERLEVVYFVHAAFFLYYVYNMLSVTYLSCGKTWLANRKGAGVTSAEEP